MFVFEILVVQKIRLNWWFAISASFKRGKRRRRINKNFLLFLRLEGCGNGQWREGYKEKKKERKKERMKEKRKKSKER